MFAEDPQATQLALGVVGGSTATLTFRFYEQRITSPTASSSRLGPPDRYGLERHADRDSAWSISASIVPTARLKLNGGA